MRAQSLPPAFFFPQIITAVAVGLSMSLSAARAQVALGIDVLAADNFRLLQGQRVGLITNQTGVNRRGIRTREILHKAPNVRLVALYTPEHGLDGVEKAGKYVASRRDALTGVMAYSLYGPTRKPTPAMLEGVDTLVYDMQDIGCRSYTYISTMIKCMDAAGENGLRFVVLDRPNPLGGERIEGPGIESRWISFVGQIPTPYVHGMTAGEIARMANARGWAGAKCKLDVVPMRGWNRGMLWRDTGLRWVRTSPNIPHADSPAYYVATGILGSLAGVDIGIGTSEPFERAAAPWMDAVTLTRHMQRVAGRGIRYAPFSGSGGQGVRIRIDPRAAANLTEINVHLIAELNRRTNRSLFARTSKSGMDIFTKVCGGPALRRDLEAGVTPSRIVASWAGVASRFRRERAPFLLY
jgi:uncharacterized protein YbbC (DUF1343 family)